MTSTSFWKEKADSLPPHVRERYAGCFEAAERWERVLDAGVDAWRGTRRALARGCKVAARGSRATAKWLDAAARDLSPSP
jgi:hypothetical protein